jgi:hypothetical protein
LNPEPEKVPAAFIYFSESPLYSSNVHVPMAAFFGALFRKDATLMNKTFEYVGKEAGANGRVLMIEALKLAFTPESQELLIKAKESWFSEKTRSGLENILFDLPKEYLEVRTSDVQLGPRDEDSLWMTFSATGDKEPIQKLISLMHLKKDGQGNEKIIGAAAVWSLGSNAKMHKKVLEICKDELTNAQGTTRALLEEIIKTAE